MFGVDKQPGMRMVSDRRHGDKEPLLCDKVGAGQLMQRQRVSANGPQENVPCLVHPVEYA